MKRNYPSFIEAFMEYTQHVGAPDKFIKWSAIAGIAACLERRTWVKHKKTQTIYPNMYVMLTAESGIARKSTATRPIMDLIADIPEINKLSTQMSTAALITQLQEAGREKKFIYEGEEYHNSSVFSYSSEAAATIGESKVLGDIQVLLTDFYDGGSPAEWSKNTNWSKTLIGTGRQSVYNPCLNILYCSTPTWLENAIGKNGIEGGFASRFIFVNQLEAYDSDLDWKEEEDITVDIATMKRKLTEDMQLMCKIQGEYKVATGFGAVYNSIVRDIKIKSATAGIMSSYYSRKLWHLIKLSQILTADKSNDLVILPETLEQANQMLLELEPEMYKPFKSANFKLDNVETVNMVWKFAQKRKRVSKKELLRAVWGKMSAKQLDEAIQTLVTLGKFQFDVGYMPIGYLIADATDL